MIRPTWLPTDQEVPESIPHSAVGISSSLELSHGIYGLDVLPVICPMLSSKEAPCTLADHKSEKPSNCVPLCGPYKFIYYMAFIDLVLMSL